MGREIKRVPVNFSWPLKQIWKGYVYPYRPLQCYGCKQGGGNSLGYTPEARKLMDEWYGFDKEPNWIDLGNGRRYNDNATQYHLTQDEVQVLVDHGRLWDFIRVPRNKAQEEEVRKNPHSNYWLPHDNGYIPTADEVNEWAKIGMGHDSLNQGYVVEHRCKKLGVPYTCALCGGSGELWPSPELEEQADAWESIDPPKGRGWQLWENVSEGSPITPVFKTAQDLVEYLVTEGDAWGHSWNREQAEGMVRKGYVMSGMAVGGKFYTAEQSAVL